MASKSRGKREDQVRATPEDYSTVRELLVALDRLELVQKAFDSWKIHIKSSLSIDDFATPIDRLSNQVATCIGVALDNLKTLRPLLTGVEGLPTFAHFGLFRNALEADGLGLWLLGPTDRDERILRSLQLILEDRNDIRGIEAVASGVKPGEQLEPISKSDLEELRDRRPSIAGRSLTPPTITKRLEIAQSYVGEQEFSLLLLWKLTSGVSHGRRTALSGLLGRPEGIPKTHDSIARKKMGSSVYVVATLYEMAEHYLFLLLALYSKRLGNISPFDFPLSGKTGVFVKGLSME